MSIVIRDLVQYVGVADYIPDSSTVFKQLYIDKNFCLPDVKLDIEQILRVIIELEIKSTKVIKTPKGTSLEGQVLTGWKLIVEGVVHQKIQYVANDLEQSVHAAHSDVFFSTFIVLPDNYILNKPVTVLGYIEDVSSVLINERCIFNNITVFLNVEFC